MVCFGLFRVIWSFPPPIWYRNDFLCFSGVNCTGSALKLLPQKRPLEEKVRCSCSENALKLHWDCSADVLILLFHLFKAAPLMDSAIARKVLWCCSDVNCSESALDSLRNCSESALSEPVIRIDGHGWLNQKKRKVTGEKSALELHWSRVDTQRLLCWNRSNLLSTAPTLSWVAAVTT